eukprot:XP_001176078.1 PREDICTED: alpha-N-acetylgalactosamine-specific lectin-like [Strongylocentrotus purpuratus]
MLQLLLLSLSSLVLAANAQCSTLGNTWEEIPNAEGFCYQYYGTPATWAEANTKCQSFAGGDLTSLDNEAEANAIYEYWKTVGTNSNSGYWIGLTDLHKPMRRRIWTDWTRLRYTNWQAAQPSSDTNDNCAYVANEGAEGSERRQWKATSCDDALKPYFCERKLRI